MSPMTEISSTISSTSTTAQRRKIKKPLIEKRRRLRINQCLASLKSLVLEATNKDENCFPKMEKADILEMTVAYMRGVKHCAPVSSPAIPPDTNSDQTARRTYLSGFRECALEVCRFFQDDALLPVGVPEVRAQLTRHLSGCYQRIQLDLQSPTATTAMGEDRPGQFLTTAGGGMEVVNCKKRCLEEDRLPSPSSSCSSHSSASSSSSSKVFFSAHLPPTSSSSNPLLADVPKTLDSISAVLSVPFTFSSARRVVEPSTRTSKSPQSIPATLQQPSSRSKPPRQTPSRHAHQHLHPLTHLHQQPLSSASQCHSPKKGDEFPAVTTTARNSPTVTADSLRNNQSTVGSRTVAFFDRIPTVEDNSSPVWRPW